VTWSFPALARRPTPRGVAGALSVVLVVASLALLPSQGDQPRGNGRARAPPMGWNNWNHFGCDAQAPSEALIKRQADAMVASGMAAAGYQFVNIDDCWALPSRDRAGNLVPDPVKFPDGIKGTAAYVHAKGLKLGIYLDAGTQTCAAAIGSGFPGSLGHERQDARLIASWGVNYLKYDNCYNDGVDATHRYVAMRDALTAAGRPIVFSISEWGQNQPWTWAPKVANLWRTTGDIADDWATMLAVMDANAAHAISAAPGAWNDPDLLEVGNGGMTTTEDRAHFSMWAVMAAPLLAGNDLATMSAATRAILTNPEVIAVDQDPAGIQGTKVAEPAPGLQIWSKPLHDGSRAVALLNRTSAAASITARWTTVGLASPAASVRDLWSHAARGTFAVGFTAVVPSHGVVLLRVTPSAA